MQHKRWMKKQKEICRGNTGTSRIRQQTTACRREFGAAPSSQFTGKLWPGWTPRRYPFPWAFIPLPLCSGLQVWKPDLDHLCFCLTNAGLAAAPGCKPLQGTRVRLPGAHRGGDAVAASPTLPQSSAGEPGEGRSRGEGLGRICPAAALSLQRCCSPGSA